MDGMFRKGKRLPGLGLRELASSPCIGAKRWYSTIVSHLTFLEAHYRHRYGFPKSIPSFYVAHKTCKHCGSLQKMFSSWTCLKIAVESRKTRLRMNDRLFKPMGFQIGVLVLASLDSSPQNILIGRENLYNLGLWPRSATGFTYLQQPISPAVTTLIFICASVPR